MPCVDCSMRTSPSCPFPTDADYIIYSVLVLLDHSGRLVYYHCVIYVSPEVETKFCSSQPAFQSLTSVVRAPWRLEEQWINFFSRFSLFQVISAYTNTGMSLVDQSMVPFQRAYPMIVTLVFLIIAGNTGFVSFPIRAPSTSC